MVVQKSPTDTPCSQTLLFHYSLQKELQQIPISDDDFLPKTVLKLIIKVHDVLINQNKD